MIETLRFAHRQIDSTEMIFVPVLTIIPYFGFPLWNLKRGSLWLKNFVILYEITSDSQRKILRIFVELNERVCKLRFDGFTSL